MPEQLTLAASGANTDFRFSATSVVVFISSTGGGVTPARSEPPTRGDEQMPFQADVIENQGDLIAARRAARQRRIDAAFPDDGIQPATQPRSFRPFEPKFELPVGSTFEDQVSRDRE
jgi:hypothetical protein